LKVPGLKPCVNGTLWGKGPRHRDEGLEAPGVDEVVPGTATLATPVVPLVFTDHVFKYLF
jgi:hypothetical protein